ncbi:MAG: hypothetical protein IK017_02580 [Paludibacteraceae bacterium]|nr:hypothetical protein [Paludibacteraceae bacterium]
MDENNKKTDIEKMSYSFDMLRNDILTAPTEDNEKLETGDKYLREYQSKLIVVQMLSYLAESYETENYKDNELLRNAIETKVDGDEQLSGYLFFVSQNPQFDYSWNYMRKCRTNYIDFLVNSIRFFNNVLVDINLLSGKLWPEKNIHVLFHDILDVELTCEEPFVKARLLWENFNRLAKAKSDYIIIVKVKDTLLKACSRKEPSDMVRLIDSVFDMLNKQTKKITENEIV